MSRLGSVLHFCRLILVSSLILALNWVSPSFSAQGFDPNGQGQGYPEAANGRTHAVPSVSALRVVAGAIRLDGLLDEPIWNQAEAATGFKMHEPDRGGLPTEETVFKVAYDNDAIYFAVACYEDDPSNVLSKLSRRDRINQSDIISVYLDPYLDRTTGYNFRVNPDGVLEDHYLAADGNRRDRDWDAVWNAETSRDEHGWYVEMRIPFSSIRYRQSDDMTWGLQLYRWMHGRGEDSGWAYWDRETNGFISRFGNLTGIRDVPSPRQLEITPYFVQRGTDPSYSASSTDPSKGEQFDNYENVGADIKYGVTSDLTMNATIQPDFGQVEADPSVLNLSPFETFFEEKRTFFIEGAQFFQHPNFNLFYSRRIGTEDGAGNSRIRFASKLTGKTAGDISVATLVAATDITADGKAHNLFRSGSAESRYFVTRFGKEFKDGAHRVNLMQTGVIRPGSERRNAYTTGLDFDLNFHDRAYNLNGSLVGSVIKPAQGIDDDPSSKIYGTGGSINFSKRDGVYRGGTWGRWEGDRLSINDLGFLSAPDELGGGMWLQRRINGDGKRLVNQGNININLSGNVFYGGNQDFDPRDGSLLWEYKRGHRQNSHGNINSWMQFRNYWSAWSGVWTNLEGTSKFVTRGGPLMTTPQSYGFWVGSSTDFRKDYSFNAEWNTAFNAEGFREHAFNVGSQWAQASNVNHRLNFRVRNTHRDAQFISAGNFDLRFTSAHNSSNFDPSAIQGTGIGGTSYVFGELNTKTLDVTLRTDLLFNRNQSLELYLQPFLSAGTYRNPRELVEPDTYDLATVDLDASQADFNSASVNLNLVYRWEYRAGSTLFLVWTHSRNASEVRSANAGFKEGLRRGNLINTEPENVFLAKFTYWFSI